MPDQSPNPQVDLFEMGLPWVTRPDVSPLRYPGGKRKLAPLIADLIQRSGLSVDLFVEPFAGGAAVSISLLERGWVRTIALADIDPMVAAFWRTVFSDDAVKLADRIRNTSVTLEDWRTQRALDPATQLDAAFKCLLT